jgi:hypothetical protein
MVRKPEQIWAIKLTLRQIRPAIWRRIEVPSTITLDDLHHVFQAAMGWTNSHLHAFDLGDVRYGPVLDDFDEMMTDERKFGVVHEVPILGNTDERIRAAHDGSVYVSSANQVSDFAPWCSALGLQFAEPEQGEPVRVGLTGHELARTLALTFGPAATHEAAMVQEEAQQFEIGRAQMAA